MKEFIQGFKTSMGSKLCDKYSSRYINWNMRMDRGNPGVTEENGGDFSYFGENGG
jgi:hypothetical protein